MGESASVVGGLIVLGLLVLLYFLPSIIGRDHRQATPILLVNLLLGWTLVGWVIALVWACMAEPKPVVAVASARSYDPPPRSNSDDVADIERFAKLRDDGLLSTDEFEAKKRAILGLTT